MKVLTLLVALVYLIATTVGDQSEEEFLRVVIPPIEKHYDSDGTYGSAIAPKEHSRLIREKNVCNFPRGLDDSQLDCKLYPNRVTCTQTCMFGHTLSDGIQREMRCNHHEDKWTPVNEFEKCEPFVDCTLTISSGGNYKCYTNFMDKGSACEVTCQRYEDKAGVPKQTYRCDINGKWTPELPFCASAGTGIKLVPAPGGPQLASEL